MNGPEQPIEPSNYDMAGIPDSVYEWVKWLESQGIAKDTRIRDLESALRDHHDWHLTQDREGDAWGIDPVDAYSESGLCERTVDALKGTPAPSAEVQALVDAVEALGAMPEGYCFCGAGRIGDGSKVHEPECRDIRAALAAMKGGDA